MWQSSSSSLLADLPEHLIYLPWQQVRLSMKSGYFVYSGSSLPEMSLWGHSTWAGVKRWGSFQNQFKLDSAGFRTSCHWSLIPSSIICEFPVMSPEQTKLWMQKLSENSWVPYKVKVRIQNIATDFFRENYSNLKTTTKEQVVTQWREMWSWISALITVWAWASPLDLDSPILHLSKWGQNCLH